MQRDILNLTSRAKGYSFQVWTKPRLIRSRLETNEMYNECSSRQEDIYIQACNRFLADLMAGTDALERKLDKVEYLLRVAQQIRSDAGFSGDHTDRGASALEDLIEAYVYGGGQEMSVRLRSYMDNYVLDTAKDGNDPEYARYLELQKKFGGK